VAGLSRPMATATVPTAGGSGALSRGGHSLGVATLQEGVDCRQARDRGPLLVMGTSANRGTGGGCLQLAADAHDQQQRQALLCQSLASGSGRAAWPCISSSITA